MHVSSSMLALQGEGVRVPLGVTHLWLLIGFSLDTINMFSLHKGFILLSHQEIGESKTIAKLPLSTIIIPKITSKMYQNDTLKDQVM